MTLPASPPMSLSQVATELGLSLPLSMSHAWVLALAGKASAPMSLSDLLGQSGRYDGNNAVGGVNPATISLSNPFFRGTLSGATQSTINGNLTLAFSVAPNWSGNILMKNNTTGASAVLGKQNSTTWSVNGASGSILALREGGTDNFTILPSN
ncbi:MULTISPECIES: hypothetical protein [unclassified Burkholderia]|uniref:hypothetical protein n=1 Tax=unclassified Burkholderia TaxID=2613784 RepID=UPI001E3B81FA|nr:MULTISPECIES: hypothetical protein [unclassified Burkholderia]UEP31620.1 hypothetical protein LMA01_20650 [Burkholderia sp. B21-007]UEP43134.1 hypothetical protein LMA02_23980 [Burkholderia sp. B21-005]